MMAARAFRACRLRKKQGGGRRQRVELCVAQAYQGKSELPYECAAQQSYYP